MIPFTAIKTPKTTVKTDWTTIRTTPVDCLCTLRDTQLFHKNLWESAKTRKRGVGGPWATYQDADDRQYSNDVNEDVYDVPLCIHVRPGEEYQDHHDSFDDKLPTRLKQPMAIACRYYTSASKL